MPSDNATTLLIKRFEDFTPKANFDFNQYSNGFGTEASTSNEEVSLEEAQARLLPRVENDLRFIESFGERYGYDWTDNEKSALASFIYNLGRGALSQVTQDGTRSKAEIAEKMLEYNRAGGDVLPGLTNRRKAESDIFLGNVMLQGG